MSLQVKSNDFLSNTKMAIFISIDLPNSTSYERIYNIEFRITNLYRAKIKGIEDCISSMKLHGKLVFNHFTNLIRNQICFVPSNHLCLLFAILPQLLSVNLSSFVEKMENVEIFKGKAKPSLPVW